LIEIVHFADVLCAWAQAQAQAQAHVSPARIDAVKDKLGDARADRAPVLLALRAE
jgi:hypothetical protein